MNGTRYRLTLGQDDPAAQPPAPGTASRFLDAVRNARGRGGKG